MFLIDAVTLRVARRLPVATGQGGSGFAFSGDGTLLATPATNHTVIVWNLAEGTPLHVLQGHSDDVYTASFTSSGRRLASGSADRTIKLWDMATGREVATLFGHTSTVLWLEFSRHDDTLLSASSDGTVRLWQTR